MYNSTTEVKNWEQGTVTLTAPTTSDVAPISRQMTLVQKLLAEHREVQSLVGQRLNAVLRPSPPAGNSEARPENRTTPSPLVADLDGFATTLQQLLNGYQDILSRLDL